MSIAVDVAKAALREIGRDDLAEHVQPNDLEMPCIEWAGLLMVQPDDVQPLMRSFVLGHQAAGHSAALRSFVSTTMDRRGSDNVVRFNLYCQDCLAIAR